MKKLMLALLAVAALGAPASAQTQAEKDSLTVEQALTVSAGLGQLAKYEAVDKDGKATTVPYDFGPDVRMLIAINIDLGRRLQSQHQAAQNDLVMAYADPATGAVPDNKRNAFTAEQAKLLSAQSRVGFFHIKLVDLRLEKNPIPPPTLSMIVPIIDR